MMGESRACHRSPVEAPVLLPQLRRGRLRGAGASAPSLLGCSEAGGLT
jgi:hypothetical protein